MLIGYFRGPLSVSVNKNTPPQKKTLWNISFQSTKWGAGEQPLPLDCRDSGLAWARLGQALAIAPATADRSEGLNTQR